MGVEGRLEAEIVLQSPASKFFKRLSEELDHLPNATAGIHSVEVHEGDFKTHGSIKSWTYTMDGKQEVLKEQIEIDQDNLTVRMVAVGGHILERAKSYMIVNKVIDNKGAVCDRVIVTVLYEKIEDDWEPIKELEFLIGTLKDADKHLFQQLQQ